MTVLASYPLSPMQQGMLYHSNFGQQPGYYIEQIVCHLHEQLDVEVLKRSWQKVIDQHPILRTGFSNDSANQIQQVVYEQSNLPVVESDWQGLPKTLQDEKLATYLQSDRQTNFDISAAPLMRLALFQREESDYTMVWTFHHALLDGRSIKIVLQEVFAVYDSYRQDRDYDLPERSPYQNYIEWHQEQSFDAAEALWRNRLQGFSTPTKFSALTPVSQDLDRGNDGQDHLSDEAVDIANRYDVLKVVLSTELTTALQSLAQEHQLTLNTLVQGAWAVLLSRYSETTDVVFGATRACRYSAIASMDSMVGLFINTLPLRVQLDPEAKLLTWLKELRSQWMSLRDYEHTPLARIQEWSDVPAGISLFDSILVFDSLDLNTDLRSQGDNWKHREFKLLEQMHYPLALNAYGGAELTLKLQFDSLEFDPSSVSRMSEYLKTLLQSFVVDPQQLVGALPLLTEVEQKLLSVDWLNTQIDVPPLSQLQLGESGDLIQISPARTERDAAGQASTSGISCFVIGDGILALTCLDILMRTGSRVLGVYSSDRSLQVWAAEHNISHPESRNAFQELLLSSTYDYLFSINNVQWIIPPQVIAQALKATINFHDSPLPKYAGLYATSWALLNGETQHAVTWHEVTSDIDAGRIFKQENVPILPEDTVFNLNTRCFDAAVSSFSELAEELTKDRVQIYTQDLSQRSYFSSSDRPAAASLLAFDTNSKDICNLVRALDFGPIRNQLGVPKIWLPGGVAVVGAARIADIRGLPGQVLKLDADGMCVATPDGAVQLSHISTLYGQAISAESLHADYGVNVGEILPALSFDVREKISQRNATICRHEPAWAEQLLRLAPFRHPYLPIELPNQSSGSLKRYPISLNVSLSEADVDAKSLLSMFAAYCTRLSAESEFDLGLQTNAQRSIAPEIFSQRVPLHVETRAEESFSQFQQRFSASLDRASRLGSFRYTLFRRFPELQDRNQNIPVAIISAPSPDRLDAQISWQYLDASIALVAYEDGSLPELVHAGVINDAYSHAITQQLQTLIAACVEQPDAQLERLPLLSGATQQNILVDWNQTEVPFPSDRCIHELFEQQVLLHPDAIAVTFADRQLTYGELNKRANQLAHYLRLQGVGADVLVGLHIERSLEMMVGLLGIHKAGGAYVPLDPDFPQDRIAFMLQDSQAPVIVTQQSLVGNLKLDRDVRVVAIDTMWDEISQQAITNPASGVKPENLSYVLYTSGSTGKPKGVMVEHRHVVNFFTGMDPVLEPEPSGVWLAVTSLSFDISVLELFWTLARGFKVVIYNAKAERSQAKLETVELRNATKAIDFSLFYFSSNEAGEDAAAKYRLLLEGCKFGDEHQFKAVWTPERHFHAFGGLFPNSAVTSAAIAATTKQIQIRAGSCVSPLHSSIRIAEDWSVVDNLSGGRVGISFAAGWQPNDFVLRPENFQNRKDIMFQQIEEVQTLWGGGAVTYPNAKGEGVEVRTLPRPIQSKLPVWITAAGNPETFQMAGAKGFHILTHLLGQSLDELAEKIAVYRQAWAENNHPGKGTVTLMIHTFVGESDDAVREIVRQPMRQYLASSLDLIKLAAWSFPTFKQKTTDDSGKFSMSHLSTQDMDEVLDFSFERYYETSGLFGTVETCLQTVDRIKGIDVDEIACLIDYGVDTDAVLAQLPLLERVKNQSNQTDAESEIEGNSVAALIQKHQVTHLQCTPSMASLLIADTTTRNAMRQLRHMMVGGEAFTEALATQLQQAIAGQIHNMYGPTETTIWSATHTLKEVSGVVPLGRAIANTELYILDKHRQPVPVGVPGELLIGGKGVTRGYLNRPELTQERFIPNPFSSNPNSRLYCTGDLARYRMDGTLEFLGRIDFQVKVRGYRIELGEIETILSRHEAVREAVITVREDLPGDKRLVAYLLTRTGIQPPTNAALREYLLASLPEYMVPSNFVLLEAFPLTPNNKVDRKALPAPMVVQSQIDEPGTGAAQDRPQNQTEQSLLGIWQRVLQVPEISTRDNFFDLGGNSLVAMALIGEIRSTFSVDLPLISLFRAPTIAGLASQVEASQLEQAPSEDLSALLAQLDHLSEEEVLAMLGN
jgi:natural product biosynthesis luciferase-like monooxygenase protein